MRQEEIALSGGDRRARPKSRVPANHTKVPRKIHRVIDTLCRRSLNRFEAAREVSDWCLHSTVAEIQRDYRIRVDRKWETVPGYQGIATRCCRYWIGPDQHDKARRVLRHVQG